jgi:hypothetical protein
MQHGIQPHTDTQTQARNGSKGRQLFRDKKMYDTTREGKIMPRSHGVVTSFQQPLKETLVLTK